MSELYLTQEELHEHTGLVQPAAQRRHLEADGLRKGVHFFVRADGQIRLLRAALLVRIAPKPAISPGQAQPNFSALPSLR